MWLAGPGWAQVFTRLPVAAWAPTSPHSTLAPPYLALQPRSSAGTPLAGAALQQGFVRGTSVENLEPGGVRRSRRRRRVMIEQV